MKKTNTMKRNSRARHCTIGKKIGGNLQVRIELRADNSIGVPVDPQRGLECCDGGGARVPPGRPLLSRGGGEPGGASPAGGGIGGRKRGRVRRKKTQWRLCGEKIASAGTPLCGIGKAVACCRAAGDGGQLTAAGRDKGGGGGGGERAAGRRGQCGLCSLVARAFRRAVCGAAASRRGSGESYQELTTRPHDDDAQTTTLRHQGGHEITIDIGGENVTYIPIGGPEEIPPLQRVFSKEDWVLLDAMGSGPTPACSGKFLTMHKRRRKKLTTRSLLQDHAILDDIHHGLVQKILDQCGKWAFNAFTLETVAGGRSLPVLCVHLFHWYGLLDYFQLDVVRVWKLFTLIEEGYHSTNPYHNSIHATDVTQAMHCFLQEEKIKKHMTPLEIMASLLGAVAHDLDHPGVNQTFLISTSNHLAILYQNMSVLENHHWRSAMGCLLESGVAEQLTPFRSDLEHQIRELILATDINRQKEFLTKFKDHLDKSTLDLTIAEHRHFILQIALKCADISNPTRPWDISKEWSLKVCDEFYRQGEYERKLNLPVTSICDQQSTSVAKIQVGFFKIVVTPLFSEWHRFMQSPLSTRMMRILNENGKRWEALEQREQAEETQTELSDAEPVASDDDGEESKRSLETPTMQDFMSPPPREIRRQSLAVPTLESLGVRRHSVPVNIDPPLPRTICRRESLPLGRGTAASSITPISVTTAASRTLISPQTESRASSGLKEEYELPRFGSQSSDVSSSSPHHSSVGEDYPERPLSAENLLPEPSITSMTSNTAVSRLTSALQGGNLPPPSKCLTRQQTFPPPQPYMRMRYMSATVEMSTCPETPHEGDSRSNSSHGSIENISSSNNNAPPQYSIPSIAVLSPNNSRPPDFLLSESSPPSAKTSGNKREPTEQLAEKEKGCKMPKLSKPEQKENVDPTRKLSTTLNLARRRGSAPVSLPVGKSDDKQQLPAGGGLLPSDMHHQGLRRGSAPVEVAHYHFLDEDLNQSDREPLITPVETTSHHQRSYFWQRRGSAPSEDEAASGNGASGTGGGGAPPIPLHPPHHHHPHHLLTRHVSLNGKSASGRRKKQLRRRSSGGPETVCVALTESRSETLSRLTMLHNRGGGGQQPPEALLVRRRGSLPIEVLTVGHSVF